MSGWEHDDSNTEVAGVTIMYKCECLVVNMMIPTLSWLVLQSCKSVNVWLGTW